MKQTARKDTSGEAPCKRLAALKHPLPSAPRARDGKKLQAKRQKLSSLIEAKKAYVDSLWERYEKWSAHEEAETESKKGVEKIKSVEDDIDNLYDAIFNSTIPTALTMMTTVMTRMAP